MDENAIYGFAHFSNYVKLPDWVLIEMMIRYDRNDAIVIYIYTSSNHESSISIVDCSMGFRENGMILGDVHGNSSLQMEVSCWPNH